MTQKDANGPQIGDEPVPPPALLTAPATIITGALRPLLEFASHAPRGPHADLIAAQACIQDLEDQLARALAAVRDLQARAQAGELAGEGAGGPAGELQRIIVAQLLADDITTSRAAELTGRPVLEIRGWLRAAVQAAGERIPAPGARP
jgi:hypothetical protein